MPPGPPPNTTGSRPPWPAKTIPPSGPGPTTAPRYPLKIDTCTPHRTRPRRKSTRRTGRRRSWDATRPDSKEKPWWADLIKEGRRARANGYSTPGYSWSPMTVIPRRPQPRGAAVLPPNPKNLCALCGESCPPPPNPNRSPSPPRLTLRPETIRFHLHQFARLANRPTHQRQAISRTLAGGPDA